MRSIHWPLKLVHWQHYLQLIRFDRPIGTLLLLYPCLTGLVMAGAGQPSIKNVVIFTLGTFLMRSAGCAINDFADKDWDGKVSRTSHRPLAQKVILPAEALMISITLCAIAFILVLFTNWQTIQLSFVAALLAGVYPFTKRLTYLPQLFLGAAFAWSIPMAYSAEYTATTLSTWVLFLATLIWTVAYDTIYAMADKQDDLKAGIRSSAIFFGDWDKLMVAVLQLVTLLLLGKMGQLNHFGILYYGALVAILFLFIYQQFLISGRAPDKCLKAFLNNQWVGLLLLIGTIFSYNF